MFFKRNQPDAASDKPTSRTEAAVAAAQIETSAAPEAHPLPPGELRRTVDPASLGFKTTAELEPISGLIGQDRALKAIQFGTNFKAHDFNLFVLGPPASGKRTAVKQYLTLKAKTAPAPADWVYVNNFENPNRPRALKLPSGRARPLAKAMIRAIDELRTTLPAMFEGEEYQARRRGIDEGFRAGQEQAFEALSRRAQEQNIAVLRTPQGFAMAPMHEGKVVKPEVFNTLPEPMRKEVEARIEALQKDLEQILEKVPKSDKERRARTADLNAEVASLAVRAAIEEVAEPFAAEKAVLDYLDAAAQDLVRNAGLFLASSGEESEVVKQPADTARDVRFRRYMVNVLVGNGEHPADGAPLHEEINPTFGNIVGRVEHIAQMGALVTDFLLIKPGALHKANGGYLLVDVRKLLLSPYAWEALKRTLKAREIRIEQPSEMGGVMSTQSLDPEPIPLEVKVVLFGDRELYYLLSQNDPDFAGLFKVQADFDDSIARSPENDRAYAGVIASIVKEHGLKAADAPAVARVIDEGARLADDREKLSIEIGRIADIVREADYWAGDAKHEVIGREDVARAIQEQVQRADRLRDRGQEMITREIVLLDVAGAKVGQINGLAVLQLGNLAFGKPSRITARVRLGTGRVTDIEREVDLGGPLHSKGVMILWSYLASTFALDQPLAMGATLVFEQSYGGVDGDSASSTELYALLSALSGVPIRQSLAVTGSVNQAGQVQAIGGANHKIEGFFDICRARGLTGEQGVLIPKANVQHLMLREDVVAAVAQGKFAVYAVETINQGIEILTGVKAGERGAGERGAGERGAGERGAEGRFPAGTINRLVEDKLRTFAERARAFGINPNSPANSDRGAS